MKRRSGLSVWATVLGVLALLLSVISPVSAAKVPGLTLPATGMSLATGGGTLLGAQDDAVINVGGAQTITYRGQGVDPTTVSSLTITNSNLAVTGVSLTVSNAYSNNLNTSISGGTLILNGTSSLGFLSMIAAR